MTANLETILARATSGQSLDKSRVFRPSWFYSIIEDPFWIWCEYHAPEDERVDETTPFNRHLMEFGYVWEDEYLEEFFPDAYQVESQWGLEAVRETIGVMLAVDRYVTGMCAGEAPQ